MAKLRECEECHADFEPQYKDQVFCSDKCSSGEDNAAEAPDGVEVSCADYAALQREHAAFPKLVEALEILRSTLTPVLRDHEVRGNVDRTEGYVLVALNQIDAALALAGVQPVTVVDHLDGDPHNNSLENLEVKNEIPVSRSTMTAVREMKNRSQQGAIKLGALFTALVLVVCSLAIGYVCGRKDVCEAPASSVTKPTK